MTRFCKHLYKKYVQDLICIISFFDASYLPLGIDCIGFNIVKEFINSKK